MATTLQYDISCNCGAVQQKVSSLAHSVTADIEYIALCHCKDCRRVTGVLCTSYVRIAKPTLLEATTSYATSNTATRYFCSTCGCHCFLQQHPDEHGGEWMVATGIIRGEWPHVQKQAMAQIVPKHKHVDSTVDGGLKVWMTGARELHNAPSSSQATSLSARCHCSNVSFHITKPDANSSLPKSYFPDLMIPYKSNSPKTSNPDNEKWWLCDGGRYLAGACACKSCRLSSGFEIQTWAFVPRTNIHFKDASPVDFPMRGVLRSYESSAVATREFCPRCGATVFWHDTLRPDLIDVSVGLFEAESARAEDWLYWWKDRVSFSEDARLDRWGCIADMADTIVDSLEIGMRAQSDLGK